MNREQFYTYLSITASVILAFGALWLVYDEVELPSMVIYSYCLGMMLLGNIVYGMTRWGYLKRLCMHKRASDGELEDAFRENAPSLTILVPSYKEEVEVVRQTLLSSMLQEYPNKSVVLLIDDEPSSPCLTKPLVAELKAEFKLMQKRVETCTKEEYFTLFIEVAEWFIALSENSFCHVSKTFVKTNITPRIKKILTSANSDNIDYLKNIFNVEISFFERKVYANLSHSSNKAMNINSYLSVMGKSFDATGGALVEGNTLKFADSEYVAVLDADTILDPQYAARLIFEMQKTESKDVAVIQTPYSAFPNAPGILEKIAGATTDIQYITHQGFTYFGATFWVGANALIRKSALEDIKETHVERGYKVTKYIQDRTVIEDTESSVDLALKGWDLHNYPERLSYSATPPDFGSLLIQRRRWANGGLLILPKLLRYLFKKPFSAKRIVECLLRFHYLFSLAGSLVAVVLLTALGSITTNFFIGTTLVALPYLLLYGRDLSRLGYKFSDTFRVMALNTVLLPVNLAGVLKSIHQGVTGTQTPFCRTPKVEGRTAVPPLYLALLLLLMLFSGFFSLYHFGFVQAFVILFCGCPLYYGILKFIRIRPLFKDMFRIGFET